MNEKALQPIEQRTVVFYDDEITAVVTADNEIYIPLRPLCDYLGVGWSGQYERINRDLVLSEVVMSVRVTRTDIAEGSKQPKTSEMTCLPLDYLNGWLFGINAQRVKESVRDKLVRYQRECYRVLAREFVQTAVTPTPSSSLQQVREMGLAIVRLAEEQMEFERRLDKTDSAVQETAVVVDGLQKRVEELEARTGPDKHVTDEQASQISQAVKAVALALGKQSGRNEFGACYGELYRKFGITSYKLMPRRKFDDAMKFLTEWHQTLVDDSPF
jgi:ferredoxin-thioredoxin reductase catalytic subunit